MLPIVVALLAAFAGVVLLGPVYIGLLQRLGFGKQIRSDGPESHFGKAGTPTMGGMLLVVVVMFLAMAMRIEDVFTLTPMLALVGVAILGAIDDFVNIHTGIGVRGRFKLVWQTVVALLAAFYIERHFGIGTGVNISSISVPIPFAGEIVIGGILFVLFVAFVIVGVSNAVNLTDGLDGLAISAFAVAAAAFTALAYVTGHKVFASYLLIVPFTPAAEITVFCGALVGASLGFLWFNSYPAEVFMGDVGSLALGGALGTVALLIKQELLLPIVGGLFVLEGLSVILQVASFKLTGKRIFRMAPLHHHFELVGWSEPKVYARFIIIAIVFALTSLATLKLR
jgi:phospho-N-acetylmuramoyl-pentapeptide-transferase